MVVFSTQNEKTYNANGTNNTFDINSYDGSTLSGVVIFNKGDVSVSLDGVVQTLDTDYTITSDPAPASQIGKLVNAKVVFTVTPTLLSVIKIIRNVPTFQELQLSNSNIIPQKLLETQLDKLAIYSQQQLAFNEYVVRVNPTSTATIQPALDGEPNYYLGWNSAGTLIENKSPLQLGVDADEALFTSVDNILTGTTTFEGQKSIPSIGLGVSALTAVADLNAITTSGHVVTSDATLNKPTVTGIYTVTTLAGNVTTAATQTAIHTVSVGNVWVRQKTGGAWGTWRPLADKQYALSDMIRGNAPIWTSNTSVTMGAGLQCLDGSRTAFISVSGTQSINFATTGLNALDTGTIASNTWYYVYAILNVTTGATGYVASTSSTSPTMPSGFTHRRLLPLMLRTNASSQILAFVINEWGWEKTELQYRTNASRGPFNSPNQVYSGIGATAPSAAGVVSVAGFCPPESTTAILNTFIRTAESSFVLGRIYDVSGNDDMHIPVANAGGTPLIQPFDIRAYKQLRVWRETGTGSIVIDVLGFTVGRIG